MASSGWDQVTMTDIARMQQRRAPAAAAAIVAAVKPSKPSKYRNVKTLVEGHTFDSQREAEHWIALRIREKLGLITTLRRQVPYSLYAPARDADGSLSGLALEISQFIADFDYYENGQHIVADAKGMRTRMYLLKKKWLAAQEGITILEL